MKTRNKTLPLPRDNAIANSTTKRVSTRYAAAAAAASMTKNKTSIVTEVGTGKNQEITERQKKDRTYAEESTLTFENGDNHSGNKKSMEKDDENEHEDDVDEDEDAGENSTMMKTRNRGGKATSKEPAATRKNRKVKANIAEEPAKDERNKIQLSQKETAAEDLVRALNKSDGNKTGKKGNRGKGRSTEAMDEESIEMPPVKRKRIRKQVELAQGGNDENEDTPTLASASASNDHNANLLEEEEGSDASYNELFDGPMIEDLPGQGLPELQSNARQNSDKILASLIARVAAEKEIISSASPLHVLSDPSTSIAATTMQDQSQQANSSSSQPMPLATKPIYRKRAEPTAGLIRGPSQYTKSQQFRGLNQPMPSLVIGAAARSRPDAVSHSTLSGCNYLGGNFGRNHSFQQPRKHRTRRQLISDELSYEQHTLSTIADKIKRQIEQLQIEEAILIHMLRVEKEQVDDEMKIRDQTYYRGLKGKGRPSLIIDSSGSSPSGAGKGDLTFTDNETMDLDLNLDIVDHSFEMNISHDHANKIPRPAHSNSNMNPVVSELEYEFSIVDNDNNGDEDEEDYDDDDGNDIESEIYEIRGSSSEISEDEESTYQANSETERAALRSLLEQYGNELF